ncbi:MAG TPA: sulfurtransferase [Burkholderiaceae bacterium]|nr:sulfurtransferase [Burkholderiaceae bacterium]
MATYTTLIDAPTLAARLGDPHWLVVDARFDLADSSAGERAYAEGHIPGAVYAHLDRDLSSDRALAISGGRHPLPTRENAAKQLAALGIGDDTQVIAYDAAGGMFAARLWWMLRWIGHEAVAVLDGGWPAWQRANLPSETGPVRATSTSHTLTLRAPLAQRVDVQSVMNNLETQAAMVLDARAPDRYDGSNETIDPIGGHIPGARNAFFKDNLEADGRFKSPDVLRARFDALTRAQPVIHQCGSGVTACHNLLAMTHVGLDAGVLYSGSWSEWVEDAARPVARGR